ncbi:unnamed protein product [Oppiella nova]|uniref:Uncharacterized protein n=1 Tax=Oppiella nova TaxID=334625 RepID=A0A7R9QIP9_9ACAR|nr:unnamed protein product [Oppiella nova]CAG2166740.1 unnamed protein product [Oppiella nova]
MKAVSSDAKCMTARAMSSCSPDRPIGFLAPDSAQKLSIAAHLVNISSAHLDIQYEESSSSVIRAVSPKPALFTKTSSRENRLTVASIILISANTSNGLTPFGDTSEHCLATDCSLAAFRPVITTCAPALAKCTAVVAPIPLLEPVISPICAPNRGEVPYVFLSLSVAIRGSTPFLIPVSGLIVVNTHRSQGFRCLNSTSRMDTHCQLSSSKASHSEISIFGRKFRIPDNFCIVHLNISVANRLLRDVLNEFSPGFVEVLREEFLRFQTTLKCGYLSRKGPYLVPVEVTSSLLTSIPGNDLMGYMINIKNRSTRNVPGAHAIMQRIEGKIEVYYSIGLIIGPPLAGFVFQLGDQYGVGFCVPFYVFGIIAIFTSLVIFLTVKTEKLYENKGNVTYRQLLSNVGIIINVLITMNAGALIGFNTTTLELHLEDITELSASMVGLIFLISGVSLVAFNHIWEHLAHKINNKFTISLIGCLSALICLTIIGPIPMIEIEPRGGFIECSSTTAVLSSLFTTFEALGDAFGPVVGGTLMESFDYSWSSFPFFAFQLFLSNVVVLYPMRAPAFNVSNTLSATPVLDNS